MQPVYFLTPPPGSRFDLGLITSHLRQLPGAFRHPAPGELCFVIAPSPEQAQRLSRQLAQNPQTSLVAQGSVTLSPGGIRIEQDAPPAVLAQLRGFVTWLMLTYACGVFSEEGDDWTWRYGAHPELLFEAEAPGTF